MKHVEIDLQTEAADIVDLQVSGARVPHLTAAVFCKSAETRGAVDRASDDRRLNRVKFAFHEGGIPEAYRTYQNQRTPMLLIVEASRKGSAMLDDLDLLAEVCDPETKVVVIGADNDIRLYRKMMSQGVSEYLTGWVSPLAIVATVQKLFKGDTATKLGKMYAFVGAKGGVGASTIAQNVAWTIAEDNASPTLLLDLDFRFGSATVNLDLQLGSRLDKYIDDPEKFDEGLLDRLIVKRGEYLSVLPGFDDPLSEVDPTPEAIERLIETARASFPYVIADIPLEWSVANREALTAADEVVIVAAPDLANLRNAQALAQSLRKLRPNDADPRLILNACTTPKRAEIAPEKFAKSIGIKQWDTLKFDPATFGKAVAEGHTLREQAPRSKLNASVERLSADLTGKHPSKGWLSKLLGRE